MKSSKIEKSQRPSYLGHRQRLKERYLKVGIRGFSEREQLELLLSFALSRRDTKPIATELLTRYGSLANTLRASPEALANIEGLGEHSAILLNLVGAMGTITPKSIQGQPLTGPTDVEDYLMRHMGPLREEVFGVLLVDQANRIIDLVVIEEGIENRAHVYIKKVVRLALDRHATGVVCFHNHPSGQPEFSSQDCTLTKKLFSALEPVEVRLLDHFLVTSEGVSSMVEQGISLR